MDSSPLLVLFDVEGTLVGRDPLLAPAWAEAAGALGVPLDAASLSGVESSTDRVIAEGIAGRGARADALLAERDAAMARMAEADPTRWRLAPMPGVERLLEQLVSAGTVLGVATRGSRRAVLSELARAGLSPDLFCVWSPGERADLFEWVVEDAIALVGADPASALVVGSDVSAAEAAAVCGARSLLVGGGEAMTPGVGADWVAASLDESDPATAAAFGIAPQPALPRNAHGLTGADGRQASDHARHGAVAAGGREDSPEMTCRETIDASTPPTRGPAGRSWRSPSPRAASTTSWPPRASASGTSLAPPASSSR